MKPLLLFVISCCGFLNAIAQADTMYVQSFALKNFVQVYGGSYQRSLKLIPVNTQKADKQIILSPNSAAFAGFVLGYKRLTLYGDVVLPQTQKISPSQTSVKAVSFFLSHFKGKWGVTGFAGYNKGLLMRDESVAMNYTDRNDMRMFTAGVHVYHIFNDRRFSFAAANSQQMQQRKSAGSVILITTPAYRILSSTTSIIPVNISKYHLSGSMGKHGSVQLYSLQVKIGYAHNFVFKDGNFFIAPSVYTGGGLDYHVIRAEQGSKKGTNINTGYRMKLAAGINKAKYYCTAEYLRDHIGSKPGQSLFLNTYSESSINVGFRF